MPIYDYQCQQCGKQYDCFCSIKEYVDGYTPECPDCGSADSKRVIVIGHGGIHCDDGVNIPWLNDHVRGALQDEDEVKAGREKPIETRGEYKKYLKDNHIAPIN